MSIISTVIKRFVAPSLPNATQEYDQRYFDKFNSILRLYFNQLDQLLGQLVSTSTAVPITFPINSLDAFGRLVTTQPYTIFDSQNRFREDDQFDTSLTGGGTTSYLQYESAVQLNVGTASGDQVVRQSFRNMPYQPGKGLTFLATFVMSAAQNNLRQRVGYFNTNNGAFLQQDSGAVSFVLRSNSLPTPGTPSDIRTVNQADWNVDPMNGNGPSGRVLDLTKNQILYMDFEWLGTGDVRCGFYVDGQPQICHIFHNDNTQTAVYMQTAILPVRYEITNTGVTALSSAMKQVCSSVMNMGGYQQTTVDHLARRTAVLATIGNTFLPMISIRLNSAALGAVVLPNKIEVLPTTSQNYEVALVKNPTLTGASWVSVPSDPNVQYDVSATAVSGGTLVYNNYTTASGSGGSNVISDSPGYKWDLQLGASIAGVSDVYTMQIRTVSGATTGDAFGTFTFYDLTQ